jgi:hypothetical protein
MNLFRSEEHARNWSGFKPDTDGGIISLADLVTLFSGNYFRRRLDDDWVSRSREYAIELGKEFAKRGAFWQVPRK